MKKILLPLILILAVCAVFSAWPARAEAVSEQEPAEWTVLFYLCGADLESKYGYATKTLEEIESCTIYLDLATIYENVYHSINGEPVEPALEEYGRVRVAIQTGGSKKWNAGSLGLNVAADRLQRWEYHTEAEEEGTYAKKEIRLMEEKPLASMADPETLRDFILWCVENYPAEKYALVLWGHGGGGKSGVLTDELFDGDRLNLSELKQALGESGVTFEAVIFDACMMASLETACAIQDNARWMAASEEVVAGQGSNVEAWLQQLFYYPDCDGKLLGRWVCDMTQIRYGNEEDQRSQDLLTWSVIDLSKIQRLADDFDLFMERVSQIYAEEKGLLSTCLSLFRDTERYGEYEDGMIDLAGVFYNYLIQIILKTDLYRDTLEALADAVVYSVRGNGRTAAMGISFCFAPDFDNAELELYALNCPFPHYLAFLDALSPTWTAPDYVYQVAERLPEVNELQSNQIVTKKFINEKGIPGIAGDLFSSAVWDVEYRLYWKNGETGQTVLLGRNETAVEVFRSPEEQMTVEVYYANDPWMWPTVEDTVCCIEMVKNTYYGNVYSIPLQIGADFWSLRCSYDEENGSFEIYGLWEGYENDSTVLGRNVTALSKYAGQDYRLVYPLDGGGSGRTQYEASAKLTMYRSLKMDIQPLPPGTYEIEYVVIDQFYRPIALDRVEMIWDGQNPVFPEAEKWNGEMELEWIGWDEDKE